MKFPRIIARLDIKGPNVVKGIHLEGLRVLGNPEEFATHYYQAGADELLYMDVVASLYERNSLLDFISKTAEKIFIPITVGGGLRTLEDISKVLRAGADKVAINTAAIRNPSLVSEAASRFGSSTIVVAIEAIRQQDGQYLAFVDNGREYTGRDVIEWACEVNALGAGEILLTSVDREGTGQGFDLELVDAVAKKVDIPVIAHGGAGKMDDVAKLMTESSADAVALASIFHYDTITQLSSSGTTSEGNRDFLKSGRRFSTVVPTTVAALKGMLSQQGINVRM